MLKEKTIRKWLLSTFLILVLGFVWINSVDTAVGSNNYLPNNYERAYTFDVENNNLRARYKVYTSVPPSLYDYYQSKSHSLNGDSDYSKFITPNAVKSIAEKLQNITNNGPNKKEEFVNNVLTFVRQIPYSIENRKYPVESIVDNSGDCDVLSFLAASIIKAENLDVVLLIYRDLPITHMNIGVNLPYAPILGSSEFGVTSFAFNNKTYWVAECTPSGNWKVGKQPESFSNSTPTIISTTNHEKTVQADVSCSLYTPLIPSAISITLSSEKINSTTKDLSLKISGSISPAYSGKKIVMYISRGGSFYETFPIVTDHLGSYSLSWNTSSFGIYYIKTSLIGFSEYASSDSETITVYVGNTDPEEFTNYGSRDYNIFFNSNMSDVLKSNFTGVNVTFTGEFFILKKGSMLNDSQEIIKNPQMVLSRRGGKIVFPEHSIIIKVSEQETNHFGFILKNIEENFSASVELLRGPDQFNIEKGLRDNHNMFLNVSEIIKENTWYKAVLNINDNEITTELQIENSSLFETVIVKKNSNETKGSGILISCKPNTVIAFKNLKTEILDQSPEQPTGFIPLLIGQIMPFSTYLILLTPLLILTIGVIVLKRKKIKDCG